MVPLGVVFFRGFLRALGLVIGVTPNLILRCHLPRIFYRSRILATCLFYCSPFFSWFHSFFHHLPILYGGSCFSFSCHGSSPRPGRQFQPVVRHFSVTVCHLFRHRSRGRPNHVLGQLCVPGGTFCLYPFSSVCFLF